MFLEKPNLFVITPIGVGGVNFETVGVLLIGVFFDKLRNEVFDLNEVFDINEVLDLSEVLAAEIDFLMAKVLFFVKGGVLVFLKRSLSLREVEFIGDIEDDRLLGFDNLEGIAFWGIFEDNGLICRRVGVIESSIFDDVDFSDNFLVNGDPMIF